MRVRVRATAAGPWGVLKAGHAGEVPDAVGRAMVAARAAVEVEAEAPPEAPIEPEPEVTATTEPEEAAVHEPPRRRRKHAQVQKPGVRA